MSTLQLLPLLLVAACRQASPAAPQRAAAEGAGHLPFRSPLSQKELPTTDPAIALGNLEGEIAVASQMVGKAPKNAAWMTTLATLYLQHGALVGRIGEYERAQELAERAIELAPASAPAWLAMAAVHGRFHRFTEALDDLSRAEKLGAEGREFEQQRAAILQAQGRLAEARPTREKWAAVKSLASLGALATVLADEGRTDQAERTFIEAQHHFPDVSPFALVALYLQEATMWQNEGASARARALLEAAHERMPADVAVISHLAAADAATGDRDRAIALLRPVVMSVDDPEFSGQLGDLLRDAGAVDEANRLRERAAARFEELLQRHPEAFADHAARFFLATQPRRALELAEHNLQIRNTADAYALLIAAALAASEPARACQAAAQAPAAWRRHTQARVLSWRAFTACGQQAEAEAVLHATAAPPPGASDGH